MKKINKLVMKKKKYDNVNFQGHDFTEEPFNGFVSCNKFIYDSKGAAKAHTLIYGGDVYWCEDCNGYHRTTGV
jgi:hypothetical protein